MYYLFERQMYVTAVFKCLKTQDLGLAQWLHWLNLHLQALAFPLHSKGNNQQSERAAYKMGKNIFQLCTLQGINF